MTILDQNRVPVVIAVKSTDGVTISSVCADSIKHAVCVVDDTTGSDLSTNENDLRDGNRKVAFMAVSSIDGITPVEVYCDTDGKLLINSN
jgi:hypothetical protein